MELWKNKLMSDYLMLQKENTKTQSAYSFNSPYAFIRESCGTWLPVRDSSEQKKILML